MAYTTIQPHLSGLFCSWGNWWLTHIYQRTLLGKPAFRAFKAVLSDSGAESPNPAAPWVTWVDRFEKVQLWETANKKLHLRSQLRKWTTWTIMDPSQVRLPHLVSAWILVRCFERLYSQNWIKGNCAGQPQISWGKTMFRGPIFASSSSLNPRSGWKIPILHHFSWISPSFFIIFQGNFMDTSTCFHGEIPLHH